MAQNIVGNNGEVLARISMPNVLTRKQEKVAQVAICMNSYQTPATRFVYNHHIPNVIDMKELYEAANGMVTNLAKDGVSTIELYINSLTAAALAFTSSCFDNGINLVAFHYDRDTGNWVPQPILKNMHGKCPVCGKPIIGYDCGSCF